MDNAVKFSAKEAQTHVRVSWRALGAGLCELSVRDQGVGFAPQQAARLFHAFARLHSARDYEGIGMGLARVRAIVQRHGGDVGAEGEQNGGCTVRISLPLAL